MATASPKVIRNTTWPVESATAGGGAIIQPAGLSTHLSDPLIDQCLRSWARRTLPSDEDLAALRALPFTRRRVERDRYIVREGEVPTTCGLLLDGFAIRQKVVRSGARQIMSFHFPGEFIDLQSCLLAVNDHSVQALGPCEVATVPKPAILELIERRCSVSLAMWFDTLGEGAIFREWVVNIGRRNPAPLSPLLWGVVALGLDEKPRDGSVFKLPLTQEHIADATGLTPVHTNRTIQALRREGMISWSARRLDVHDWNALRSIGDFSDLYLHSESARPRRG
jgi:CRP-like cAMP-binding protein